MCVQLGKCVFLKHGAKLASYDPCDLFHKIIKVSYVMVIGKHLTKIVSNMNKYTG